MSDIIIYTGEKGLGKSTYLQEIFLQKQNVCGILQPRMHGIKYLVDITSGEKRRLELEKQQEGEKVLAIGKYVFAEETLLWGRKKLSEAVSTANNVVVVDEIGPLELSGSGLEPVLSEVVSMGIACGKKLILVVRPKLVEDIILKYNLFQPVVKSFGEKFWF